MSSPLEFIKKNSDRNRFFDQLFNRKDLSKKSYRMSISETKLNYTINFLSMQHIPRNVTDKLKT